MYVGLSVKNYMLTKLFDVNTLTIVLVLYLVKIVVYLKKLRRSIGRKRGGGLTTVVTS